MRISKPLVVACAVSFFVSQVHAGASALLLPFFGNSSGTYTYQFSPSDVAAPLAGLALASATLYAAGQNVAVPVGVKLLQSAGPVAASFLFRNPYLVGNRVYVALSRFSEIESVPARAVAALDRFKQKAST